MISLLFIALGGEVGILNCIRLTSVFNVEEPRFGAADAASPIFFDFANCFDNFCEVNDIVDIGALAAPLLRDGPKTEPERRSG